MIGIKNGMVMQRNQEQVCDVLMELAQPPAVVKYSDGAAVGICAVEQVADTRYRLTGIPVGGPYTVCVDDTTFEEIYVGDVWLLAGQSNMEGIGHRTEEDRAFVPRTDVRALFLNNEWGAANHPLHDLGNSHFRVHALLGGCPKPVEISVGPGLSFGLSMYEKTGVPQGLICCAHGATNLAWHWAPSRVQEGPDASLYAAMLQRVRENGGNVRGMFWYQGCSDAEAALYQDYTKNMIDFAAACRRDLHLPLPIVQVQIGRTISRPTEDYCFWWNNIQDQQRLMDQKIPAFATVSAISKGLDDAIHIDSKGQRELGREAAEAMCHLVFGELAESCLLPPQLDTFWFETTDFNDWLVLKIRYKNLHGGLTSAGRPTGFGVLSKQPWQLPQYIYKIELDADTAVLYLAATAQMLEGCVLVYGHGQDPVCNITDFEGRAIPAMGPIPLNFDQSGCAEKQLEVLQ